MSEYRGFDILDYFVLLVKWKKQVIVVGLSIAILTYFSIYFFVDEQFDSKALVVAAESDQTGGIASLMKSFSNLPVNIPGLKSGSNTDIFTTLIYSRTNLESLINKFDLQKEYGSKNIEEALKELGQKINAGETKEGAYEIIIRDKYPNKAADMVNYTVEQLNLSLIDLNISKSRDNRMFLETRYNEIKTNLRNAEDSLVIYQSKTGIFSAEDQAKASLESYAAMEGQLSANEIQYSIISKLYGQDSPQALGVKLAVDEYRKKINELKSGKDSGGLILALNSLPQNAMKYFRHYRDVQIYTKMLEFIIPIFEQAKFEEQKNIPVLKVIDKGVPAIKKSYPPRTLLTIAFTLIIMLLLTISMFIYELLSNSKNLKVMELKKGLSWGKKNS